MDFLIADSFTAALTRLSAQDQKAAKTSAFDLQLDPTAPGLQMHRIGNSKDPNFWSVRVNLDLRIIVHKTASSLLLAYVDHHDQAYAWAERRRIEAHPRTGVAQIVEVRERVEETVVHSPPVLLAAEANVAFEPAVTASPRPEPKPLFAGLSVDQLLSVGVPADWTGDVRAATEDDYFILAGHLPAEAAEALLEFATTGVLVAPAPVAPELAFEAPDALRRFRMVESQDDLALALEAPWETWSVFLHPSQRAVVERVFSGPARVAGSAGTGKTVVALHRAARLLRGDPNARVLLTTFSEPLAGNLKAKLGVLTVPGQSMFDRVSVASFQGLAEELFQLVFARKPRVASADQVTRALSAAASDAGLKGFSQRFLVSEWAQVIDAWRVTDPEAYANVPRLGRKNRLGSKQRAALWPVFEAAGAALRAQSAVTPAGLFHTLADHYAGRSDKPFTHIVVDEAQDLGVPELRLLTAIAPADGQDRLFFAGDLGQRIFQQPFSWKALGADVRGRSYTLKVNYRTSQQIRSMADTLLPAEVRDVDGRVEDRRGAISVFDGPAPMVELLADRKAEEGRVAAFIRRAADSGVAPGEIGVFVRSRAELPRARTAVEAAGLSPIELSERPIETSGRVAIGTMHLAKGLEFKVVAVMACDDEVLPLAERIEAVVEENDLDEVFDTERHLLYVACTRARDRLLVTGVKPGSEFLMDLMVRPGGD